eukprot:GFUD01026776.1.p1 GENE.GFUD01026776.1~~GFUD01026776.1.p1  ORF type:complete len:522 (+),score=90.30 GFUD01026776.1:225-1790(+)
MPSLVVRNEEHVTQEQGRDDLCTMDEVKVFKDEGEKENDQDASENLQAELLEEESRLATEPEHLKGKHGHQWRAEGMPPLSVPPSFPNPYGMGYLVHPYPSYANGASHLSRVGSPLSPFTQEPLGSPPPAHMGSLAYDKSGLDGARFRSPLYPSMPHHYGSYGSLGMDQLAALHQISMYQQRGISPYSLPSSSGSLMTPVPRFPHSLGFLPPHHPSLTLHHIPPHHMPSIKPEYDRPPGLIHPNEKDNQQPKKEPHIKKPLNAFMLYMKEMRPVVQAECTLKESAAINQILGRRWHGLTREEQAQYYEKAREERQRHQQLYPNWNARDNYRYGQKTKKRKRDKSDDPAANIKKCRARYGVEQQTLWCKPCKRKKKCIRVQMYLAGRTEQEIEATTFNDDGEATTPLGNETTSGVRNSCSSDGSVGEGSPASGSVEYNEHSLTSPGGELYTIPIMGSPAASSVASHFSPEGSRDQFRASEGYKCPTPDYRPVGSDPRDSKNPLSISSMTGCYARENGFNGSI